MNARSMLALTLLELLAVVSILGVSTVALVGVAGPMSAGQRRAQAILETREFLDRVRLRAESGASSSGTARPAAFGRPSIEVAFGSSLRASWSGQAPFSVPHALIASLALRGCIAMLSERDGGPIASDAPLRFWPGGWSDDAVIELRPEAGAPAFARLELLGLSGQIRELARSEAGR